MEHYDEEYTYINLIGLSFVDIAVENCILYSYQLRIRKTMETMKKDKVILVTRSSMPDYKEYCEEIKDLWDSHWLTNMGVKHRELQRQLEEYLECPHVVLYTNGHLALENVITAMQFPHGSEIITTPFTFASTTHAIVRNGLIPVFCDVREDDYTIDANQIESLITEKTVAIVPVQCLWQHVRCRED